MNFSKKFQFTKKTSFADSLPLGFNFNFSNKDLLAGDLLTC